MTTASGRWGKAIVESGVCSTRWGVSYVRSLGNEFTIVCVLLAAQAGLLAYSATRHSPTDLEPAFLASGLSHWKFGRFEAYRVNPPLVRMVAAIPVIAVGYKMNWAPLGDTPGSRVEYGMGQSFLKANEVNSIPLFFYARWACIPFNVIGAYFAYRWSRELYGGGAGLCTLILYVFEPNLLAHGELITPDGATTAFCIVAGYAFWLWLKQPSWIRAGLAGGALGLAELSKMSLLILFILWPVLWLIWCWMEPRAARNAAARTQNEGGIPLSTAGACKPSNAGIPARQFSVNNSHPSLPQLATILLLGIYVIDLGYGFDCIGTPLKDFQFVSKSLTGLKTSGIQGNRFRESWLGHLRVPLPKQYVLGFDSQKKDLEGHYLPSYLRGEWKRSEGWWYYYVYGLFVKVPCGTWGLLCLVVLTRSFNRNRRFLVRDEIVLLAPAIGLLVIVSSQTAFNHHLRYVFPSLGISLIFLGQVSLGMTRRFSAVCLITSGFFLQNLLSLALVYPHHLAYFNGFVGGPQSGYRHLLGSSLDWGQDLLYLRDYVQATGCVVEEARGSYIPPVLFRTVIPDFESKTADGQRIIVISPNIMLTGGTFPSQCTMLTPTFGIVRSSKEKD